MHYPQFRKYIVRRGWTVNLTRDDILLLAAPVLLFLGGLLKVLIDGAVKQFEARYLEKMRLEQVELKRIEGNEDREQSSIELATQLLERYSTRLENAYDRKTAQLDAALEEVARLRIEVATLRIQVSDLNTQLARLMGVPSQMLAPPVQTVAAAITHDVTPSAVEKREAEVGPKPDVSALVTTNGVKP